MVIGVGAAVLAAIVHLHPLTAGRALSVWAQTRIVAVTGLIAGWPGSAVLLLFLTVLTLAACETLGAAFCPPGGDQAIAGFCVLVIVAGRRIATGATSWTARSARVVISSP